MQSQGLSINGDEKQLLDLPTINVSPNHQHG